MNKVFYTISSQYLNYYWTERSENFFSLLKFSISV